VHAAIRAGAKIDQLVIKRVFELHESKETKGIRAPFFEVETRRRPKPCKKRTAALQQPRLANQSDVHITKPSKRRTPPPSAAR
jgi:hypothetical protein